MKLLLLTPQLPYPPRQGAAMRNYNILRYLSPHIELSLLSFAQPPFDGMALDHLSTLCHSVSAAPMPSRDRVSRLRTLALSTMPDLVTRLPSAQFRSQLDNLMGENSFDIVQVEGLELAGYVSPYLGIPDRRRPKFVLDEHNAEYMLQKSAFEASGLEHPAGAAYSFLQWRKLRLYEAKALSDFDAVTAVSQEDARALEVLSPERRVAVLPNGVDTAYFQRGLTVPLESNYGPLVLFTGSMDYRPNVDAVTWFVREVWPAVLKGRPDARFYIVGRNPLPVVQELASVAGVTVTGGVPDVRPFLEAAGVFVVPMRMGGGVRLKVLEAMAMEVPIVATHMGMSGVDYESGRHALVADEPKQFAGAVLELIADEGLRSQLAKNGVTLAATKYDWSSIIPGFRQVYCQLLSEEVVV